MSVKQTSPTWAELHQRGFVEIDRPGLRLAVYQTAAHGVALASQTGSRNKMGFLIFGVNEVPKLIERLQAALESAQAHLKAREEAQAAQTAHEVIHRLKGAPCAKP